MKFKRLLPITTLAVVAPTITLATSCNKHNDIDVNITNVTSESDDKFIVTSQTFNKIKTNNIYEISIEFDKFIPTPSIDDWSKIGVWWVCVCDTKNYAPILNNKFIIQKVEVNDVRLAEDEYMCGDNYLEIKGKNPLTKPYGGWQKTEIDIDVKISEPLSNVRFASTFLKNEQSN